MTIESSRSSGRLEGLDALRGIAALIVVLFHYTTRYDVVYGHRGSPLFEVPWGHFGVNLFFGISGFVIFMTLDRTRSAMDFVVSRFSRLYPAYWVSIALTTAVVSAAVLPDLQRPYWVIVANLTMLQGAFEIPSVDGVYWTLLVELFFYAAMLALFMTRQLGRIEAVLVAWIGLKWLWWGASVYADVDLSYKLGLLLVQKYIPFFAIGICAFRMRRRPEAKTKPMLVTAFALLTIAVIDGLPHLSVALITTVILMLIAFGRAGLLTWKPLTWLGAISYPLYLLHENIGWTVIAAAERSGFHTNAAIGMALCLVVLLSTAVTLLVERPVMGVIRRRYAALRPPSEPLHAQV